jgi:hypothetical protein
MRGRQLLRTAVALAPWLLAVGLAAFTLDLDAAGQARRQVRTLMPQVTPQHAPEHKAKDVTYAPGEKVPS